MVRCLSKLIPVRAWLLLFSLLAVGSMAAMPKSTVAAAAPMGASAPTRVRATTTVVPPRAAASSLTLSGTPVGATAKEQSFFGPTLWTQELTSWRGWGADYPRMLADVNGDGKQDIVGFGQAGVWLATSTGTGFNPAFVLADLGFANGWRVTKHVRVTGDVNGDGLDDIVGFGDAGVYLALSTAAGFTQPTFAVANFGYNQGWRVERHVRVLADVNGDRRKDIVAFGDDGVWIALSTGSGFEAPRFVIADLGYNSGWRVEKHVRLLADVNGDGRDDIVAFGDAGVWTALSTGTSFEAPRFVIADLGYNSGWRVEKHVRLLADVNGDRRMDIVAFGDAGVWTALWTDSGFAPPRFVLANFGYNQGWRGDRHPRFVADLNGDGYQDIVGYGDEAVIRALGGPGGFAAPRPVLRALVTEDGFGQASTKPRFVGDFNGDGKQDLVGFYSSDIEVALSSDLPPRPAPAPPSNPGVLAKTQTTLTIAWNDNSMDERRFRVNWGKGFNSTSSFYVSRNVTSQVLSGLQPNTGYCFTVQAENLWDISAETPQKCAFTLAPPPTPTPAPTATPAPQGISRIDVFNCNDERRPVHIWTRDIMSSSWVERGTLSAQWDTSGSCPGAAAAFQVPLESGHSFWFVVVDPQLIGCDGQNDPEATPCQRSLFTRPLPGLSNGPVLRHVVN